MWTRRVWLRRLTRAWAIGTAGYAGGAGVVGAIGGKFMRGVWYGAVGMAAVLFVLVVLLLWLRRRAAAEPTAVQRHLDSMLPSMPTADRTERKKV